MLKIDFQNKSNPLTNLGLILSVDQMLYLLIAMWIYPTIPDKMLMVIAMIFGAHLLPFSWLYKSNIYLIFSILIPFISLFVGLIYSPVVLAATMILSELLFCLALTLENKKEKI